MIVLQTHHTSSTNEIKLSVCKYKQYPSLWNCVFPRLSTVSSKHDPNKNLSVFYLLQKETFFYTEISRSCISLFTILLAVSSLNSHRSLRAFGLNVVELTTNDFLLLSLALNLKQNASGLEAMAICFIFSLEIYFEIRWQTHISLVRNNRLCNLSNWPT